MESYECSSLNPTFEKRFYIPYTIFHFLLPVASYLTDHNAIKYLRLSLCEERNSSYTFVSSFLLTFFHLFLSLMLKHSDNEVSSCSFLRLRESVDSNTLSLRIFWTFDFFFL